MFNSQPDDGGGIHDTVGRKDQKLDQARGLQRMRSRKDPYTSSLPFVSRGPGSWVVFRQNTNPHRRQITILTLLSIGRVAKTN